MTDICERLRELLAKATPGPWEVDTIENDGAYGSGPDAVHGFKSPVMLDAEGKALFDAYNSDLIEVHEEYDEDSCHAWDEQGRANFALVAAAVNALPDLLATIESLRAELAEARGLILDLCDELEPYVEEKWGYDERLKRQYDRDMGPAVAGRAFLTKEN